MSTIQLAAHRSGLCDEAIYFTRRQRHWRRGFSFLLMWLVFTAAVICAGLYAHLYWQYHHVAPVAQKKVQANRDTVLSDMHYVYVSKPFPPASTPGTSKLIAPLAGENEMPDGDIDAEDNNDWRHTPDGMLATQPLPEGQSAQPSLQERLMQALKEQQQDYSPSADETVTPKQENDDKAQGLHTSHIPPLSEQPDSVQQQLPALRYQSHIYSTQEDSRKVVLNDKIYKEGDHLTGSIYIKTIEPQDIIVDIGGHDYSLPALTNWQIAGS